MQLQCTMSSIFDWEVRRLGMHDTLKHGTITVLPCFKDKFRKYNTLYLYIRHIPNISDFVWFQRSCGSMKSVSSFSSIEALLRNLRNNKMLT